MMILVFGILSSQNGKSAWMESVRTTKFGYDKKSAAATIYRGTTSYGGDEFKSQDVKPGYLPEEVNVSLPSYGGSRTAGFGAVGGVGSV